MSSTDEIVIEGTDQALAVKIGLIVMGFIVFSPFSSILVMDILGLPISLPELLFLPFLFVFRKRYRFSHIGISRGFIFLSVWLLMIPISILADNYTISAIVSSSRTYLTLIISYLFFSKWNNVSLDDIMFVSLGATLGYLYSSTYGINIYLAGQASQISRTGNILAIPLLLSIAVFRKHNKILIFSIFLCIAISLTAGMRRQILVFLMSMFLTYGFLSLRNVNRFLILALLFGLLLVPLIAFLPKIEIYTKENIPVLYHRVFEKTEAFLADIGHNPGDVERLNNMQDMVNNLTDYIIPKGFVSRRTVEDMTGKFIDFPFSELFYMFGIFAIGIIGIISTYTVGCYFQYYIKGDTNSIVFVVLSLIMLMLLFLEGTFLSSSYVAPVTGYCLGRLKYHSKMVFKRPANKI